MLIEIAGAAGSSGRRLLGFPWIPKNREHSIVRSLACLLICFLSCLLIPYVGALYALLLFILTWAAVFGVEEP